jgi:hypothetical protein
MRVLAETARSRLTLEPSFSPPKFVRRRVSGAHPILNDDLVNSVTVRQVPSQISLRAPSMQYQHTIDTDAVAQMGVTQYILTSGDGQRCAAASRGCLVKLLESGNS